MVSFVTAVDVDFDCPDEIYANEEFKCSLEVFDGDGIYDVKIDLDGERNSILEVWNDETWKSGYYYLNEFIGSGDEEDIKLKVSEDGNWDGELKLRKGSNREFFEIEIDVEPERDDSDDEEIEISKKIVNISEEIVEPEVILLGNEVAVDELVYVSKDSRVVDWLPYGFSLFLIFVIGILLIDKF